MKKSKRQMTQRDRLHEKLELVGEAYLDIIEDRLDSFIGKSTSDEAAKPRKKK